MSVRHRIVLLPLALMLACTVVLFGGAQSAYANPLDDIASFFAGIFAGDAEPYAAGDVAGDVIVDGNTMTSWEGDGEGALGSSTQNVGRIWTDKTVLNDGITLQPNNVSVQKDPNSNFLVGLSALSSTSNLITTTKITKPLDIVLVLDESSSMSDDLIDGGYRYTEVYGNALNKNETYYISGEWGIGYRGVEYNGGRGEWGYYEGFINKRWVSVAPKQSASDVDGTQFYTREWVQRMTNMEALQQAVNSFIDKTAGVNESLPEDAQHRISIVTYSDNATIEKGLTNVNSQHANELHVVVNGLRASGNTQSGEAMQKAQDVLESARESAKKVVIFFTDGAPSGRDQNWDASIAEDAINTAKELKVDQQTTVYCIGVFEGADASDTNGNENKFMNATSSNYPQATATSWGSGNSSQLIVTWGEREAEGDYYKVATDADELNKIFDEISDEIQSSASSGSPTYVEEDGGFNMGGYITFEDELGAYMQVTPNAPMTVVYKNQAYTSESATEGPGGVKTYSFGNVPVDGNGVTEGKSNLQDIIVTVTPASTGTAGEKLKQGDAIKVQIPASLIPLRSYEVNTGDGEDSMSIDPAYPIRVFYNASVKPDAVSALNNPDKTLGEYIEKHKSEDGSSVAFYSNLYTGEEKDESGELVGDTTATFTPSNSNSFYYFVEDTYIYTDEACTEHLKGEPQDSATYYYKNECYELKGGKPELHSEVVTYPGNSFALQNKKYSQDEEGNLYIVAGTPRKQLIHDFHTTKTENNTRTTGIVVSPDWAYYEGDVSENSITTHLGNNGIVNIELPGTLSVSKEVESEAGFSPDANQEFKFHLTLAGAPEGVDSFTGKVMKGDAQQGDDVTFSAAGGDFTLRDGETLYVYGLSEGMTYAVTENLDDAHGYTAENASQSGAIQAGQPAEVTFVNTYKPDTAIIPSAGEGALTATKRFVGRDMLEDETFGFTLSASGDSAQAVEKGTIELATTEVSVGGIKNGESKGFGFGDIAISKPGTYTFEVKETKHNGESLPEGTEKGITFDRHTATYTVEVADDGSGKLSARVTPGTGEHAPEFINSYTASPGTYDGNGLLGGTKMVKVESGEYTIKDEDFSFYMRPLNAKDESYPLPEETDSVKHVQVPDEDVTYLAALVACTDADPENNTATYDFGSITFSAPGMYCYSIFENSGNALPGISYDRTSYTVTFEVEDEGTGELVVSATAVRQAGDDSTPIDMGALDFTNTYNAGEITGYQRIEKVIDGRTFRADDEFAFEVSVSGKTAAGESGTPISFDDLPKPDDFELVEISEPVKTDDGLGYTYTATMRGSSSEGKTTGDGDTGVFTYTQPGVYTFVVTEKNGGETIGSMTYDDAEYTVVVTITQETVDGEPVLKRSVTMNGESLEGDEQLGTMNFTNKYTPKPASIGGEGKQGITVQKTLTGRDWSEGDSFTFELSADDGTPMPGGEGSKVTIAADKDGAKDGPALTGTFGAITYTKDDLGETADGRPAMEKTFTYEIRETSEDGAGVTVDKHVATVRVTVKDDGKGKLSPTVEYDNSKAQTKGDQDVKDAAAFTNTYKPSGEVTVDSTTAGFDITKKLTGKAWNGDAFSFTISGKSENAKDHLPKDATVTVSKPDAEGGDTAEVKFGAMTFDAPGAYVYKVKENVPQKDGGTFNPGMTYDDHEATVTVTVSDNLMGGYKAEVKVDEGAFTNKYDKTGSVEVDAAGGFAIVKHLDGRDIAKDQFEFTLSAAEGDASAQEKLPKVVTVKTVGSEMDKSGVATETVSVPTGLKFTQADAGKSFNFTVSETKGGDTEPGYQNDAHEYAVVMKVSDDGRGTLTVAVYVDGSEQPVATWTGAPKAQAAKDAAPVTFEFNNFYDAVNPGELGGKAEVAIEATKTLTGRDMLADEFAFVVKNAKGTQVTSGENAAADDGEPAAVTFDKVEYTTDKLNTAVANDIATVERKDGKLVYRFEYTVSEQTDGLEAAGVTPEGKTSFDVTVTVTDDGAGSLTTAVSYPKGFEDGLAFKNAYKEHAAAGNTISLAGTKVLKSDTAGAAAPELAGGEFEFTLTGKAVDGTPAPMPATGGDTGVTANEDGSVTVANEADGPVNFGDIAYSVENVWGGAAALAVGGDEREKTFTYTVTEEGSLPGVHNDDDATKTITVMVKDDGKGNLTVEKKADDGAAKGADFTFTNTYSATAAVGVPVDFEFTKTFEGHEWTGDYAFQFTMTGAGGAPMPEPDEDAGITANADGSVTKTVGAPKDGGETATFDFGSITYTEVGEYKYTVTEVKGDNSAIAYDTHSVEVMVNVTDKDADGKPTGKLVATATMTGDPLFTNTYEAGTVDFDTEAGLAIRKTLTGRAMDAGDFTFVVTPTNEAGKELFGKDGITLTNDAAELGEGDTANVSTMTKALPVGHTFSKKDAGKSFEFTVSEQKGGTAEGGYTYDGRTYEVAIKVADDGAGKLTVETWVDGKKVSEASGTHIAQLADAAAQVVLDFENTYEVETPAVVGEGAAVKLAATKTLTGRDMAADEFTFEVRDAHGTVVSEGTNAAAADGAAGAVTFGDIKYKSMAQLNEAVANGIATRASEGDKLVYTYVYTVAEVTPEAEGVTPQTDTFTVTVRVTDDGAGTLSAEVVMPEGSESMDFVNTYGASAQKTTRVKGAKTLDVASGDHAPSIAGEYTFTLTGNAAEDGTPAPMPAGSDGQAKTAKNDASGTVDFGDITYTMENVFGADAAKQDESAAGDAEGENAGGTDAQALNTSEPRRKTFTYTVEESGEVAGVTNDPQGTKTFTVTVTDNGDGTLSVEKSTTGTVDFTFTNTYSVDPTEPVSPTDPGATGGIKLTKSLTGRDMAEGEFSFELRDADGRVVSTGSNAADGSVSLPGIVFDAPGTYRYALSEAAGKLGGITYDDAVYNVTATVDDDGDGTLSVAWNATDAQGEAVDAIVFENAYETTPTSITFRAAKLLDGRALQDGEFTFELREGGKVLSRAVNDEQGAVTFDKIAYTESGSHDYEIVEVAGDDENVTYDGTVHTAHVDVTDDGVGHLNVAWAFGETGEPVFRNTYTAPATPEPPATDGGSGDDSNGGAGAGGTLVQTGDNTALMVGGVLGAAAVALGTGIYLRRRMR